MTKIKVTKKKLTKSITKSILSRKKIKIRYDKNQGNQEKLNKSMTKTKFV